jgi:hypothetical protein
MIDPIFAYTAIAVLALLVVTAVATKARKH